MLKKLVIVGAIAVLLSVSLFIVRSLFIDWIYVNTGSNRHAPEVYDGDTFLVCLVCQPADGDFVTVQIGSQLLIEKKVGENWDGTFTITSPDGETDVSASSIIGKVIR